MQGAVRLIDRILRLQGRIFEFSQEPAVILRLQFCTAPHQVSVGGVSIFKGDPIIALHTWNERLPVISPGGADLAWAFDVRRRLVCSFNVIAALIEGEARYANAKAIYGRSALFSFSNHTGGLRMMQHLGFTILPDPNPLGRFGDFWENLLSWGMMWAFNRQSLHTHTFWRLQRTELWMARAPFLTRFGQP